MCNNLVRFFPATLTFVHIIHLLQLSDQKQVNSWSSRDKLSAPVVYDVVGQQYIGVFNNNQISTWEESCVQLNNLKKVKVL